ncbi:feruloyl-CoA synthase [Alcanivorax sp. S71-1-4]|uniref:feruloyl-CoA synthase n=1 Tax=Alcanivorax sp. S71-1-4 TaxID=1177159 RepID=UPI0013568580|nr:feruloyl-CoA synthase [Alcanivorax sp. S71-1-4]KAF0808718.1 feruloyl-CoA synthase [Alcanivorax sp. S71-1-4]
MSDFFADARLLAPAEVQVEYRHDGSFVMRSPCPLAPFDRCIGEWLERWAANIPDRIFLAERRQGDWYELSYGQAREQVGALAQALLDCELPAGRPLVILSDNDIHHALLTLAAMHVGIPVSTVSVAYSRAEEFSRLVAILDALSPGLIFVSDAQAYARALTAVQPGCPVLASDNVEAWPGAQPLADWFQRKETAAVQTAFNALTGDHHARYLLTSGSTGTPKVVINTHRMLCANQQMIRQCWGFLAQRDIVVLDWLPWSHTFGANHNFNLVLSNGGSLYLDDGRPVPGLIEKSIDNLRSVRPTLYFNVPRGYDTLLPYLEQDPSLAQALFGRLDMLFYAAAALPQKTWDRLLAVSDTVRETPPFMASEWGATETSPVLTSVHFPCDRPGNLGLPVPGIDIKFVPAGDKLEMRVRGASVFSEYLNAPQQTAEAFDDEGFYCIGDAGYLLDPQQPHKGITFNGRVSEDFKLTSGTWVSVGTLRLRLVSALSPYAMDCVIAGQDQPEVSALMFASPALRALAGQDGSTLSGDQLAQVPAVREALLTGLRALAAESPASSQHITRLLILDDLPSIDAGEITDKGYLNQRKVLSLRDAQVERLYAETPDAGVICLDEVEESCA